MWIFSLENIDNMWRFCIWNINTCEDFVLKTSTKREDYLLKTLTPCEEFLKKTFTEIVFFWDRRITVISRNRAVRPSAKGPGRAYVLQKGPRENNARKSERKIIKNNWIVFVNFLKITIFNSHTWFQQIFHRFWSRSIFLGISPHFL